MRTIFFKITTGMVGCNITGEFEVEDDMTDDEIDEIVVDEMWNRINFTWNEKDKYRQ